MIKIGEWLHQQALEGLFAYTKTQFTGQDKWRSQEACLYLFNMLVSDFEDRSEPVAPEVAQAHIELINYAIGEPAVHSQRPHLALSIPLTSAKVKSTRSFGPEASLSLAHLPKDFHPSLPFWTAQLNVPAETTRSLFKSHVSRLLRALSIPATCPLIARFLCLWRSTASWTARI